MTALLPGMCQPFPVPGIRLGVAQAGIKRQGRDDLLVIETQAGASCAALFTRNAFCAAPVIVAREHLASAPRWLVVNSGNANAGTGERGLADARQTCECLAGLAGGDARQVLPFSTGVIGEYLPLDRLERALPEALASLDPSPACPADDERVAPPRPDGYPLARVEPGRAEVARDPDGGTWEAPFGAATGHFAAPGMRRIG